MKKQFTSQELAEALRNKTLENMTLVYSLVKQGDDPNTVLICPYSDYQNWISIPLDAITTAEYIEDYTCPDGSSYPQFALYLTVDPRNPLAVAFAMLLKAAMRRIARSCKCQGRPSAQSDGNWYYKCYNGSSVDTKGPYPTATDCGKARNLDACGEGTSECYQHK